LWLCGGGGDGWLEIGESYSNREERVLRVVEPIHKYRGQDTMARAGVVRAVPPVHLL